MVDETPELAEETIRLVNNAFNLAHETDFLDN